MKLTAKQELFCTEYLIDLNATQSAIRAGYSEKTAKQIGPENLSKPYIAQRIAELNGKRLEKATIGSQYVLDRLHDIDQLDVTDIIKDDLSGFKPLNEWPKSWRISINAIDMKRMIQADGESAIESVVEKIKWPDKTRNLELIGKHVDVGAFSDDSKALVINNNIMPVPSIDNIDDWESAAQDQQDKILNAGQ